MKAISLLTFLLFFSSATECGIHMWRKKLSGVKRAVGINIHNPNSAYAESAGNLLKTLDKGLTWTPVGLPGLSPIHQIVVHPSDTSVILCIGFTGGMRRTTNGGSTWTTVLSGVGINGESIAFAPASPDTMFVGDFFTGNIYRSVNRGASWTYRGTTGTELCALQVRSDTNSILLAGTAGGTISKSTDGGSTWRLVKPGGSIEIPKIVACVSEPMTMYAAAWSGPSGTGIWKSSDGGETWFVTGLTKSVWSVEIHPEMPNLVFAADFALNSEAIFRSTDGGIAWDTLSNGLPPSGDTWAMKMHPLDTTMIWLALSSQGIYRHMYTETVIQGIVVDTVSGDSVRTGNVRMLGTGDSVSMSTTRGRFSFGFFDGDTTAHPILRFLAFPYLIAERQISFLQDSTISTDIRTRTIPRTSLAGTVFDSLTSLPVNAVLTLASTTLNGQAVFKDTTDVNGLFAFDSLLISEPSIVRYDRLTIVPVFPYAREIISSLHLPEDGLVIHVPVSKADILVTGVPTGSDVSSIFGPTLDSMGVRHYYWDSVVLGTAPLSSLGALGIKSAFVSTGTSNTPLDEAMIDSLISAIQHGTNLFLSGRNIAEHNDSSSLMDEFIGIEYAGDSQLSSCRGTDDEILDGISFNMTGSDRDSIRSLHAHTFPILRYRTAFEQFGVAGVRVDSVDGHGRIIFFSFPFDRVSPLARYPTFQRILSYFNGGETVDVDEDHAETVEWHLKQNYPNPFNPTTSIEFDVRSAQYTTLRIYDMLGQFVEQLVDGVQQPGKYRIEWSPDQQSAGVYFYQLRTGNHVETRKLILLR